MSIAVKIGMLQLQILCLIFCLMVSGQAFTKTSRRTEVLIVTTGHYFKNHAIKTCR